MNKYIHHEIQVNQAVPGLKIYYFVFLVCLIAGCSNRSNNREASVSNKSVTVYTGADSSWSFDIYLPVKYSINKKWPVIFAFDPHGDGKYAVNILRDAAEEFEYIVIGSNTISNGIENPGEELTQLFKEVQQRYSIDMQRIYATGFSGGGRIASYFGFGYPAVKSIASAGAGISNVPPGHAVTFSYLGISGTSDFNFNEVLQTHELLDQWNVKNSFLTFSGGHEWYPKTVSECVFLFFEADAIRRNQTDVNKIFRDKTNKLFSKMQNEWENENLQVAVSYCRFLENIIEPVYSTHELKTTIQNIQNTGEYKQFDQSLMKVRNLEQKLQREYLNNYQTEGLDWWKNEIQLLDARILTSNDSLKRDMFKRVHAFLSIVSYTQLYRELGSGNKKNAEKLLNIYALTDSVNSDYFFGKAWLYKIDHEDENATQYLDSAKLYGFKNEQLLKKAGFR